MTAEEFVIFAESDLHPEVQFKIDKDQKKIDQDQKRERLLLCSDEERSPFLNWVTDINRLSRQQLYSLLPQEVFETFPALRAETVSAVAGSTKLPTGLNIFKKNISLPSRVAITVDPPNEHRLKSRVTYLDITKPPTCPPSNQVIISSKLYFLYFVWKRLTWDECVAATRLPVEEGCESGLPKDFFALFPIIRTWSNHASSGEEGTYWLTGLNLTPNPPTVVELPELGFVDPLPPVFHKYLGKCAVIVKYLRYKPGKRRACIEDNTWEFPADARIGEGLRNRELSRRKQREQE